MHGGREEEFIFLIRARSSLPVPLHMRIKALYLLFPRYWMFGIHIASWQKKEITPGMSTFCEVRDFNAMIKSSSSSSHWKDLTFPFLKKHDRKSQPGHESLLMLQ